MKNNQCILLIIALFLIIVIFVDLNFNFSSILMNNYENYQDVPSLPRSVVAKIDGRVINIKFMRNDPDNSIDGGTIFIPSPTSQNRNITVNGDGTLSETLTRSNDVNQQWSLVKINNESEYNNELGSNESKGYDITSKCVQYPFYIIKSNSTSKKNPSWCLQYDSGKLTCNPIGNYDSQKWDVSNINLSSKNIYTHNSVNTNLGSFRREADNSDGDIVDSDKVKINLNINDESMRQLLGLKNGGNNSYNNNNDPNKTCDTYVPRDSIKSICKGCDI